MRTRQHARGAFGRATTDGMKDDIITRLKRSIDAHAPVSVEDLREAVAVIHELRDRKDAWRHVAIANADSARPAPKTAETDVDPLRYDGPARKAAAGAHDRLDDLEARLSHLERSVRDNTRRFDLAYRECLDLHVTTSRLKTALEPGKDTSDA